LPPAAAETLAVFEFKPQVIEMLQNFAVTIG
jgi:hypothetical protein